MQDTLRAAGQRPVGVVHVPDALACDGVTASELMRPVVARVDTP